MSLMPENLRQIPLFANITDQHLSELVAAFEPVDYAPGQVIFEPGDLPQRFEILTAGLVSLYEGDVERFRLKPVAPLGELSALTGMPRRTRAVASDASTLLCLDNQRLMRFFEDHGDVAFPFHHNLLRVVARKVRRDQRRLQEMRSNIMTTQKALKRMREALLDAEDTPLSAQLFEEVDALIEQNKKGHYLLEPSELLRTEARQDNGQRLPVLAISNERLHLELRGSSLGPGDDWAGVLMLGEQELPATGTVDAVGPDTVVVDLDPLYEDYARLLEDHLTRLQMLDVVL